MWHWWRLFGYCECYLTARPSTTPGRRWDVKTIDFIPGYTLMKRLLGGVRGGPFQRLPWGSALQQGPGPRWFTNTYKVQQLVLRWWDLFRKESYRVTTISKHRCPEGRTTSSDLVRWVDSLGLLRCFTYNDFELHILKYGLAPLRRIRRSGQSLPLM